MDTSEFLTEIARLPLVASFFVGSQVYLWIRWDFIENCLKNDALRNGLLRVEEQF